MLGSKNYFFFLPEIYLKEVKRRMRTILKYSGRLENEINLYEKAFEFFCRNPKKYDGSTASYDLVDIRIKGEKLDLDAMVHDYEWVVGANRNYKLNWESNIRYFHFLDRNGKGKRFGRLCVLQLVSLFIVPFMKLKYRKK